MKYFFILGNHSKLSALEIFSLLTRKNIKYNVHKNSQEVLILDINDDFYAQSFIKDLGGTIKIGLILEQNIKLKNLDDIEPLLLSYINDKDKVKNKIKFGFSIYSIKENLHKQAEFFAKKAINKLGFTIKNGLRDSGHSVSYMVSKQTAMSSVFVKKNNLLNQGGEFDFFILNSKNLMFGQTLAIQDFEKYSHLDYGRPARDSKSGMLPPKLAKMMVNIAGVESKGVIYDPFCGSGTVLEQAMILGYSDFFGSDKSQKAIDDTCQNIEWVTNVLKLPQPKLKVFQSDIRNIELEIPRKSVNAIVTEPYLGPPLEGHEIDVQIKKNIAELAELYLEAFKSFKSILKKGGRIVMIIPAFVKKDKILYVPIEDGLKKAGIKIIKPFESYIKYSERGSLIYKREGQHVVREIYIFE